MLQPLWNFGTYGHRLNSVGKPLEEFGATKEEEKEPKDKEFTATDSGKVPVQVGKSREERGIKLHKGAWEDGKRKMYTGEGGTCSFDGVSPQGVSQDGGKAWQAVSSTPWTSDFFSLEEKPLGLKLENSFDALDERDSDQEIPMVSCEDFSSISLQKQKARLLDKTYIHSSGWKTR